MDVNSDANHEEILARLLTPTFLRWLSSPPSLPSSSLDFLITTHTKTLALLTSLSLHAPRLLIEEELAWAYAAEGNQEGFENWAGKVVEALRWVRQLGLDLDSDSHLAKGGQDNGADFSRKGGRTKKVKKWRGKESMPPSGLKGLSTWVWYIQDPNGRVPGWGWRRREREREFLCASDVNIFGLGVSILDFLLTSLVADMEKELLKGSGSRGVEIEEGLLNGMFGH